MVSKSHQFASEFVATAFLLVAVVGSGIAAEGLSGGNGALALLVNALVTGCALFPLILVFAPISGAHMNPVVTLAFAAQGRLPAAHIPLYIAAQCSGAVMGVWAAHLMFGLPILQESHRLRLDTGVWCAEVIASIGLIGTVLRCETHGLTTTAGAVAAYITGAYWFTSSTSFANPAATLARSLTDTFAGIAFADVPAFVVAQLAGLVVILVAAKTLNRNRAKTA